MTIELHLTLEPDFIDSNLCAETARYLLALAGVKHVEEIFEKEKQNADGVNHGGCADESSNRGNTNNLNSDLDSEGLPWDYRIHSSAKTKTAEGKWKMKRNATDKIIADATKNNKAVLEAPSSLPDLFPDFMKTATKKISEGKLDHLSLVKILQAKGIPDIPAVKIRQDLIPEFVRIIEAL